MVKLNNEIEEEVFEEGFVDTPAETTEKGTVPRVSPTSEGFVDTDLMTNTTDVSTTFAQDNAPQLDLSMDAPQVNPNIPEKEPVEVNAEVDVDRQGIDTSPIVSEEEAKILPRAQSEIDQEGAVGQILSASRNIVPSSGLGGINVFGFKSRDGWGSSEARRRSYSLKVGGNTEDSIFTFENYVLPNLVKQESIGTLTAKDVAALYRDSADYIQSVYLDMDEWRESSGKNTVEDTGRSLENVMEGFNQKLLYDYLADSDKPWNKDNPDAFKDAHNQAVINDGLSYFNKDKIKENLPSYKILTKEALGYYFGVTEVQAFKDQGVPPYRNTTANRMFDNNGNLRRYDPEIENNIWTGVAVERLQDVENWRDVGRTIKYGALAVPALPHHITSLGGWALDSMFGEGTGHAVWESATDSGLGSLARFYDENVGGPAAQMQAEIIFQGDMYHSKNINNFVKFLSTLRGFSLVQQNTPIIGTKANIKRADQSVKAINDPNSKITGFAPGSAFSEMNQATTKGWLAKLKNRKAATDYNMMSQINHRGYGGYLSSVQSGMLYNDVSAALVVSGINYNGIKNTWLEETFGDVGVGLGVGSDLVAMMLTTKAISTGIDRAYYNTEHTAKKAAWHVKNGFTGGGKDNKSYVQEVYGYTDKQMANMSGAEINYIKNVSKQELKFINEYERMKNDFIAQNPDAAMAVKQMEQAETRMNSLIVNAIKENNQLLPEGERYTTQEIEQNVSSLMTSMYFNDGTRTLLNSMQEVEALPWSGNIDFKVLTSKNQRHKVLQLHAQINQQSLDMLKLLLPPTGDASREAGLNVLDKMNNFLIDQQVLIKEEVQASERAINTLADKIKKDSEHPEFPVDPQIANLPIEIDGVKYFDPIITNAKRNLITDVESNTGINIENLGDKSRSLFDSRLSTEKEKIDRVYESVRDVFKDEPIDITDAEFSDIFEKIKGQSGIKIGDESRFAEVDIRTSPSVVNAGSGIARPIQKNVVQSIYNEGFQRLVQSHLDNQDGGQTELQEIYAKIYNLQGADIPDIKIGKETLKYDDPTIPKATLAQKIKNLFRSSSTFTPVEGEEGLGTLITLDNLNTWRGEMLAQARNKGIDNKNRKRLYTSAQDLGIVIDVITQRKINRLTQQGSNQSDISDIVSYQESNREFMNKIVKPYYQGIGSRIFDKKSGSGEFSVSKTNLMREFFKIDDPVSAKQDFDAIFPRRAGEDRVEAENILKAAIIRDIKEGKKISSSYIASFVTPILGYEFADKVTKATGSFSTRHVDEEIQRAKDSFQNKIFRAESRMNIEGTFLENLAKVARSTPENPTAIWEVLKTVSPETINKTIKDMVASNFAGNPFDPKYVSEYNQQVQDMQMDFGSIIADAFMAEVVNTTNLERIQSIGGLFDQDPKLVKGGFDKYAEDNNLLQSLTEENIQALSRVKYYEDINTTAAAQWMKENSSYLDIIDPSGKHKEMVSAILGYDILKQATGKGVGAFQGKLQATTLSSALAKVFSVLRGVVSLRWIGTDAAIRMNFRSNLKATAAIIQSPNVAARINEVFNEGRYTSENVNYVANFVRQALALTADYSNEEIIDVIMKELNVEEFEKLKPEVQERFKFIQN